MVLNVIECYGMLLSVETFMNVHELSKKKVVNDQSSKINSKINMFLSIFIKNILVKTQSDINCRIHTKW